MAEGVTYCLRDANAASKQATGASATPTPIHPVCPSRWAMPVWMRTGQTGRHDAGGVETQADTRFARQRRRYRRMAAGKQGAHRRSDVERFAPGSTHGAAHFRGRVRDRTAEAVGFHNGTVPEIELRVGLAVGAKKPPCGATAGAVNQRGPVPASRTAQSTPLRVSAVTIEDPAIPRRSRARASRRPWRS